MSGPDHTGDAALTEFDFIARVLRPLAADAPEALNLTDDAAVLPSRPGFDLVVTQDAIVEGVHFLPDDPPELVARKLLRVNLSDLAAKGAAPYGYLLTTAWPAGWGRAAREAFVRGLAEDQAAYGLKLFGGDTVATPGPATFSVTMMGWVPAGEIVRRSGAKPGDVVFVTGTIGDGWLGLLAARGELDASPEDIAWLADRYHLPRPRVELAEAVRSFASAAADVSDGLIADAGHIAGASGVAIELDLDALPLSEPATRWLALQPDRAAALASLSSGGDDYEIIGTSAHSSSVITVIGEVREGRGASVICEGRPVVIGQAGYRHDGSA